MPWRRALRRTPRGREVRALDQHVGRRRVHLGLAAAHHAGQRDRALGVRDHQILGIELARLAVERRQLLARARAPHAHLAAAQLAQVEAVQRLAELEQHQVRDVDHDAAAAQPRGLELALEPVRRRAVAHAAHHARDIAVSMPRAPRSQTAIAWRAGAPRSGADVSGQPQRAPEERPDLARHAEHATRRRRDSG